MQTITYHSPRLRTASLMFCALLVAACPAAQAAEPDAAALAKKVVAGVGVDRGVCAVVGGEPHLLSQLVRSTRLLIHVREPDAARVAELRRLAEKANLGIDRLIIARGALTKLPHADNMIDAVLSASVTAEMLAKLPAAEVIRVLRPEGKAILAGRVPAPALAQWANAGAAADVELTSAGDFAIAAFAKPPLDGADDWPLWEHGPDNNPVSNDRAIRAPYMTQFLAEPFYIGMPCITTAAAGRTFLATGHIAHHEREWNMLSKLIARNGYNGTILWERPLPPGYLSHRSAFVATKDVFYMIDGDSALMLDPQTGAEKGRIRIAGAEGDWKWMTLDRGVLYVLAGAKTGLAEVIRGDRNLGGWGWGDLSPGFYARTRVPWGFGDRLVAYRLDSKRVLWSRREDKPMDSRALALRDGKLFLYCPEEHLRCLDAASGKVLWTNADPQVLRLIEEPGRRLISTPGFRSSCIAVATPKALILQGQTRMNVVSISTRDGRLLWTKRKVSSNPNVLFLDGGVVLAVGRRGNHVLVDPVTGEQRGELGFNKRACTRLTACPDSLFVRGEGLLRYDRASKKVLIDGAARPNCNDGALPANGMLYLGPWACDCNLSLIGANARCPAGDFRFDHAATEKERLTRGEGDIEKVAPFDLAPGDWPMYRRDVQRSASSPVSLARPNTPAGQPPPPRWTFSPRARFVPAPPVAAGGLVFVAGSDGRLRALDERTGRPRWSFATNGPIKAAPTVWEGRVFVGSGDGYAYALEAATGRLLWKFRAAPVERLIMVYGNLCSTWPVNTGVLVHEGVAYFAAGIIDYDGTYVYALDAKTGKILWQNIKAGHLNPELRKGVSAQGNLTLRGELLMAGGNQISPARFDLKTGECRSPAPQHGMPTANHGKFVGVLLGKYPLYGGRTLYASPENVANKDSFRVNGPGRSWNLNFGGVPPAWNDELVALVNFRDGKLTCMDATKLAARIEQGLQLEGPARRWHFFGIAQAMQQAGETRWMTDMNEPRKFEVESIAVCPGAVVAVVKYQRRVRAKPEWALAAFLADSGTPIWFWRWSLPSKPLPGGLLVGRYGQIVVALLDGRVISFGPRRPPARPQARKQTNRKTDRRTGRPTDRRTGRPTDRRTDRPVLRD